MVRRPLAGDNRAVYGHIPKPREDLNAAVVLPQQCEVVELERQL